MAGPHRSSGRVQRILLGLLFWTAVLLLIAGVVNTSRLVRSVAMSKRLGESGLRGVATITEKRVGRAHPRGSYFFYIGYQVTSPRLSETREAVLQAEQWYPLEVGRPLVYLYEESDPAAGILEVERPYVENWFWHHFGVFPAALICGGYVGWRVMRRWRRRAGTAR